MKVRNEPLYLEFCLYLQSETNKSENMKKVLSILMVAVALMMAIPAQAQLVKFGVKGGMNFSKLDTNVKKELLSLSHFLSVRLR